MPVPPPVPLPQTVNPDGTPGGVASGELIEASWGNAVADSIQYLYDQLVPIGVINLWGAAAPPVSWLMCDGAAVSRATYGALFSVLGTTWGVGDGTTTFTLPNLRARFPIGLLTGDALFGALNAQGGGRDAVLPSHQHATTHDHPNVASAEQDVVRQFGSGDAKLYSQTNNPGISGYGPYNKAGVTVNVPASTDASDFRGESPVNGRVPPFVVVNFIIKAQ